jgi:ADP-heptose:LPS heptosyltransferase
MKILIIRFSSIGDIVLTTPIIRCIKNRYPNAEIHYATKKNFASIMEANPYISKIHILDKDIQPLVLELLKEKFDVIIDLHKNFRSRYIKSLLKQAFNSKITYYTFNKLNVRKWLLANFKWNIMPDKSIVDRYFEGIRTFDVANDGQGLDYFTASSEALKKDDVPMSHSYGYVACAIGGQHATKQMPIEQWRKLCEAIKHPIMLLGGEDDFDMAEKIKQVDSIKIYNACGKFSMSESAQLIQKSKLVITHDTGLMHVAAAYKKNVISIWGNTIPELGMFPYYGFNNLKTNVSSQSFIFQVKDLVCRPCSKIGFNDCPKKHFNCMQQIQVLDIVSKAHELLGVK